MSITRKITASVELVMPFDDAVKGGYQAYLDDFDRSKLELDGTPSVFHVAPISYEQKDLIDRELGECRKKRAAVQCGLRDVTGYTITTDGKSETLPKPTTVASEMWGLLVDNKWMALANFDDPEMDMLSMVIRRISGLNPL